MALKLKTIEVDEKVYAEMNDGKAVYIDTETEKEISFDADFTNQSIKRLNHEAMTRRDQIKELEETVAKFDGIGDVEAAKQALQTMKNLDDKKLIDAGEVDAIKREAIKAVEQQFQPTILENTALKGQLHKALIGDQFTRSKFVSEKVAIPVDFLESKFMQHFSLDGNNVVATDGHGNKIYSKERPGELASFEESIETLIDQHPDRDRLLKGRQQQGSGSPGGDTTVRNGQELSMQSFNSLSPKERAEAMEKGARLVG
jgi:hypothetical protein